MAVTFGCPLVGTKEELNPKILKKGQRAYATNKSLTQTTIEINGEQIKAFETAWKTGDGIKSFSELAWDINPGGDTEDIDLSDYYTKEEIDNNKEDINNKLQGYSHIMDDYIDMNKETADQKYPSAKRAYGWAYDAFSRVGKVDIEIQNIKNTLNEDIVPKIVFNMASIDNVENIAKGANQAIVYDYYFDFIEDIDIRCFLDDRVPPIGNNILIKKLNIPDLWIMEYAKDASDEYLNSDGTYKDFIDIENVLDNSKDYFDEEIVLPILEENGCFYTKYAKIGQLETQKVDLTEYENTNNKVIELSGGWDHYSNNQYLSAPVTGHFLSMINDKIDSVQSELPYFYVQIEQFNDLAQRVTQIEQQLAKLINNN